MPIPPSVPTTRHRSRLLALAIASSGLDAVLLALALGGPRALLGHTRALTLLAVWAAGNLVLAWLRPVRASEVVESAPDPAVAMLALVAIPLVTPAVAAFGERAAILPLPVGAWLPWFGIALVAVGLVIRTTAMTQLGPRFTPVPSVQAGQALETRGLYAHLRHPGYLGSFVVTLGGALAFRSLLGMPLVALMAVAQEARVRREERLLEHHFGDAYRRYRERAGRYLPRLHAPPRD